MSNSTAAQPIIKTWQERTGNHNIRPGSVKHMIAEISELRAALAGQSQAGVEKTSEVRAAEWQPIATVPMDGSDVLLYLPAPYSRIVKARWFDVWENWIEGEFPDPQDEYCGIGSMLPTHWMNLPAAPSTADSADTGEKGSGK